MVDFLCLGARAYSLLVLLASRFHSSIMSHCRMLVLIGRVSRSYKVRTRQTKSVILINRDTIEISLLDTPGEKIGGEKYTHIGFDA